MDEEKKSKIEKMGDKKRYLARELANLLKSADIGIFSAFNDYEDAYFFVFPKLNTWRMKYNSWALEKK